MVIHSTPPWRVRHSPSSLTSPTSKEWASEQTDWEDVPTTGSENSDEYSEHPQKPTSEREAGDAKQQGGGCDLRGSMQGLLLCVHWRDRENFGEMPKRTQDSSEEEWPQERHHSSCLGKPAPSQLRSCLSQARGRSYWRRRVLEALHIHQPHQTSNLDCGLNIIASWLLCCANLPSPSDPLTPNQNTPPRRTPIYSLQN